MFVYRDNRLANLSQFHRQESKDEGALNYEFILLMKLMKRTRTWEMAAVRDRSADTGLIRSKKQVSSATINASGMWFTGCVLVLPRFDHDINMT